MTVDQPLGVTAAPGPGPDLDPDELLPLLTHAWHPVCRSADLRDAPVAVQLLGEDLVVARLGTGRGVEAFSDLCPHRGTKLSLGWVDDGCLVCPYHGWSYDAEGSCVRIPALRTGRIPGRAVLARYHAVEHLGLVWVCPGTPRFPLPRLDEYDDPAFRVIDCEPYVWACSSLRRIENFVDFAHFPWVHDGVLGDRSDPFVPDHEVWRDGLELRLFQPRPEPRNDEKVGGLDLDTGSVSTEMHYRVFLPTAARLEQRLPAGRRYVLLLAAQPLDATTTRTWWFIGRNYDLDPGQDAVYTDFQRRIVGDDRPIVESQRPERLPIDLTAELHIREDRVSLELRRWLRELLQEVTGR